MAARDAKHRPPPEPKQRYETRPDGTQVIHTETYIENDDVRVGSSGTLSEIINMADAIYKDCKDAKVFPLEHARYDKDKMDDLYDVLKEKYKDFRESFPVPFRWIVHLRKYDTRAFRRWMEKVQKRPGGAQWSSREEFIEWQVDYLVTLERQLMINKHVHWKADKMNEYKQQCRKMLKEEEEKFQAAKKTAEEHIADIKKDVEAARRLELLEHFAALAEASGAREASEASGAPPSPY